MDIESMEAGRALDALIAEKVMGWQIIKKPWSQNAIDTPERRSTWAILPDGQELFLWHGKNISSSKQEWLPSTDIKAAFEVAEKIRQGDDKSHGSAISLGAACCVEGEKVWAAKFDAGYNRVYQASAPTAPLAICKAALLAIKESSK